MDDCERKYMGDQVRTLQMKCDLLGQQSEQQQQLIMLLRNSKKDKDDIEGKCRVSIHHLIMLFFNSVYFVTLYYMSIG